MKFLATIEPRKGAFFRLERINANDLIALLILNRLPVELMVVNKHVQSIRKLCKIKRLLPIQRGHNKNKLNKGIYQKPGTYASQVRRRQLIKTIAKINRPTIDSHDSQAKYTDIDQQNKTKQNKKGHANTILNVFVEKLKKCFLKPRKSCTCKTWILYKCY